MSLIAKVTFSFSFLRCNCMHLCVMLGTIILTAFNLFILVDSSFIIGRSSALQHTAIISLDWWRLTDTDPSYALGWTYCCRICEGCLSPAFRLQLLHIKLAAMQRGSGSNLIQCLRVALVLDTSSLVKEEIMLLRFHLLWII